MLDIFRNANASAGMRHNDLPQQFLSELLARTDVVELIGRTVRLRHQGDNHIGLCPFHNEKSPSFSVSQSKQFYHCFGCGKHGNAIHFLREHSGLSFMEAVKELAQAANLALPDQVQSGPAPPDTTALQKVNELAAAFYRHCLRHDQAAKDYLKGRRLPSEATERFVIGFAPAGWNGLNEAFADYQTNAHIVGAGLVIERDDRRYDRFRERIMFGIRDHRGRLLGFGGRTIGVAEPKYLNSPATALFDKSAALFGVYEARESIRRSRQAIVVEGYMDVAALSMSGVENCVATMGTACTQQHIERLMALCDDVVFAFDGDAAGRQAAWKSMVLCLRYASDERSFRFLLLPPGRDPDEIVLEEGLQAFKVRIDRALTLSGFLMHELSQRNNHLASTEDRARFAQEGLQVAEQLPYSSNLRRLLREEILKASTLKAEAIAALASHSGAGRRSGAPRRRADLWDALTQAIASCPEEAALQSAEMLKVLPPPLQDGFFLERWSDFPSQQVAFWRALFNALDGSGSAASRGDNAQRPNEPALAATTPNPHISAAHQDLLRGAARLIEAQLQTEQRQSLRSAFRDGAVSEEQYLRELAAAATGRPGHRS